MIKYYIRIGLKQTDDSKTSWDIYSPDGHIFCTVVGIQKATKLRDYLNDEFIY